MKKKLLLPLGFALFAANSFAIDFYAGQKDVPADLIFSKCEWTYSKEFVEPFTKTKPGSNDYVGVRPGNYTLTMDKDVKLGGLYVGANTSMIIDGRKIDVKRNMDIRTPSQSQHTRILLKPGSVLNMGGSINFGLYEHMRNSGDSTVFLDDSTLVIKNNINYVPESGVAVNKKQAVWGVNLTGKSLLDIKGNILSDVIFKEIPNEWLIKYVFTEKNGVIPRMVVAKDVDMTGNAVELNITTSKPGKFVLIECHSRKGGVRNLRYVSINGKRCSIGDSISFGSNSTATLLIEPAGKDLKTNNDLVLEIK